MIAHRLSTIQTAKNILFLEENNSVLSAVKGTEEYDKLITRLININYAHQKDNPTQDTQKDSQSQETKDSNENINQPIEKKVSETPDAIDYE